MNTLQSLRIAASLLPKPYAPTVLSARRALASEPLKHDEINYNSKPPRNQSYVSDHSETSVSKEGVQGTIARAVNTVTDTAHKVAESIKEVTGFKSNTPGENSTERSARMSQEHLQDGAHKLKESAQHGFDAMKQGASNAYENAGRTADNVGDRAREGASQARDSASQAGDRAKEYAQDLKEGASYKAGQVSEKAKGAWERVKQTVADMEPERQQQRADAAKEARGEQVLGARGTEGFKQ